MMREKVSLDNEVCKDLMEQNDVRVMSQESIIRARYDEWNNLYTQPSQSVNFHSFFRKARSRCFRSCSSPSRFFHTLIGFVPIVSVLSTYSIRRFLLNDIVGGFTVGVMHVPQGDRFDSIFRRNRSNPFVVLKLPMQDCAIICLQNMKIPITAYFGSIFKITYRNVDKFISGICYHMNRNSEGKPALPFLFSSFSGV
ncbi:hypothetical protein AB6A40_008899 [Gnathostoma spinigerum]|uniref:Uncharacterized protein n=1 Tax=Gnathostoma spinigerum TaxID=75299 RepID=A0ABD6EQE4_9BILA